MNQEGYFWVIELNPPGTQSPQASVAELFARSEYFDRWAQAFGTHNGTMFIFPFHMLGHGAKPGNVSNFFKHYLWKDYFVFYQIDDKFYWEVRRDAKVYLKCTDEAHINDICLFVTDLLFNTVENYSKYL